MSEKATLSYVINDPLELNLSYMPFINNGGLFVPTTSNLVLGDNIIIELELPGQKERLRIEGKVIWITPKNVLHHVLPGVGVQFTGSHASSIRSQIEAHLDSKAEMGRYAIESNT